MAALHFKAQMKIYKANPYIHVSAGRAKKLRVGWRKPMPVLVQINNKPDKPWEINMMPIGDGSFYLYLHSSVRKASKTKVGDHVMVDVSFDTEYKSGPMHPMPVWFRAALAKNKIAKKNWADLIPSRQKEILRYFSWLKSQAAIDRNLAKAVGVLSGQKGRFMARLWEDGV